MTIRPLLAAALAAGLAVQSAAQDEAKVILRSTVVGNQEQPNVLYIVPWQQAEAPELIYRPLQSLVDGVFRKVDREEFLRELHYQRKIEQALPADG